LPLPMRHLYSIEGLSGEEIRALVKRGGEMKRMREEPGHPRPLEGQVWALIFAKSSTRTRVSFEVGIRELGGSAMFLSSRDIQLGRGEPVEDMARVLGRMVGGAVIRTYAQSEVEIFGEYSGVPTINALTDEEHPCQILADLLTIDELLGGWEGRRVCFLGDGDCNVARSWIWAAARTGLELVIAAPGGYQPPAELVAAAGGRVRVEEDVKAAVEGSDVLYTDVWVSMGKEEESAQRLVDLAGYQVDSALVGRAKEGALVMHCLPAYRGKEITAEVMDEHAETIFTEAENRLHAQKAVMEWCVQGAG